MKTRIIIVFFSLLLSNQINCQEDKKVKIYHAELNKDNKVSKIIKDTLKAPKIKIEFEEQQNFKTSSTLIGFAINNIISPLIFNTIDKLFYKPENFIKKYSKSHSLISKNRAQNLDKYKKLVFKRYRDKKDLISIEFSLTKKNIAHSNGDTIPYTILQLNSLKYKYTTVKLKKKHPKVNLIVSVSANYFDSNGHLQTLNLTPFVFSNQIPKGENSSAIEPKKETYRFISNALALKTIHLEITEINSRKKDWDSWLELYNNNKEKLQSFTLEKIDIN